MLEHRYHEVEIPSSFGHARRVEDQIVDAAVRRQYDEEDIFALRLSLEEALINAIRHGNRQDMSKHIRIRYRVDVDEIEVSIADEGAGFDPAGVPDPTLAENLEHPSGRGIMLMRAYMNDVEYNRRGNEVRLRKRRAHGRPA